MSSPRYKKEREPKRSVLGVHEHRKRSDTTAVIFQLAGQITDLVTSGERRAVHAVDGTRNSFRTKPNVCVVVAAGRGARLGGVAKALLSVGEETFLGRIAGCCRGVSVAEIVVVVASPYKQATALEAQRLGLAVVENPEPDLGMGSSVAVGFGFALQRFHEADSCWLWPVDHPFVAVATLELLSDFGSAENVVIPTYKGRGGHPVLVGRSFWQALAGCARAPKGARSVFRRRSTAIRRIDVADPGVVADVDLPSDLTNCTKAR